MSVRQRLWPSSEDDWCHSISGSLGHAVYRHCGTSASRSPPGIPHRVLGLLLQVHHTCTIQQSHREHGEQIPPAPRERSISTMRTIHINHAKPAKFTALDFPEPVPSPEASRPPLGYLPAGLAKPRPPPAAAAPAGNFVPPPAAAPANQQPAPAAPAESAMPPPAIAPASQRPEPASLARRSPRLNPEPGHAHAIKSLPENPPHHSSKTSRMVRTYPLTVSYNECLGSRANSLSFTSLRIVDLRNGQSQYLSTIKQLVDALPKTVDPSSRFEIQGHIARPGQKRFRRSMRAAI